ncbi:MAG: NAD(P)H-hydrate dehydratase [Treponema lecithinolyticum]|uniref:NAD(P)H-hydrate dehydratase n=1 Tax=Treponema lecithinolyticum TaxID=53418 RepID=UPI003FA2C8FE
MKNLYTDTRILDRAAVSCFGLTEDILMENAASALENEVVPALQTCAFASGSGLAAQKRTVPSDMDVSAKRTLVPEYRVLIVCGSGNNGGDGWALARRLNGGMIAGNPCSVTVFEVVAPKSQACVRQAERAQAAGVPIIRNFLRTDFIKSYHVIVDCLFGSGFYGALSEQAEKLICAFNKADCFKIACDIPSGIDSKGCGTTAFCADITVCMGALKTALFSDFAKNHTGKIITAALGVSSTLFESGGKSGKNVKAAELAQISATAELIEPAAFLLEASDMELPERLLLSVHKGDFGHAAVYTGEKPGAGIIAACAAFRCGAGLVSLVSGAGQTLYGVCSEHELQKTTATAAKNTGSAFPCYLMQSADLPEKASAVAAGMGFGRKNEQAVLKRRTKERAAVEQCTQERAASLFALLNERRSLPCVLDADLFYCAEIKQLLKARPSGLVLTPHPKEFQSLLSLCGLGSVSVGQIAENRLELVKVFCSAYPGVVLLLKGANMTIGYCSEKSGKKKGGKAEVYINMFGMPCLAKGGSGDVLAGLVCAFLAQKYKPLNAAIQGSLLLAASSRLQKSSYSSTPFTLIQSLEKPEQLRAALR